MATLALRELLRDSSPWWTAPPLLLLLLPQPGFLHLLQQTSSCLPGRFFQEASSRLRSCRPTRGGGSADGAPVGGGAAGGAPAGLQFVGSGGGGGGGRLPEAPPLALTAAAAAADGHDVSAVGRGGHIRGRGLRRGVQAAPSSRLPVQRPAGTDGAEIFLLVFVFLEGRTIKMNKTQNASKPSSAVWEEPGRGAL